MMGACVAEAGGAVEKHEVPETPEPWLGGEGQKQGHAGSVLEPRSLSVQVIQVLNP